MAPVQYRIELNSLTKPASCQLRFLPQLTAGYDEVVARLVRRTDQESSAIGS